MGAAWKKDTFVVPLLTLLESLDRAIFDALISDTPISDARIKFQTLKLASDRPFLKVQTESRVVLCCCGCQRWWAGWRVRGCCGSRRAESSAWPATSDGGGKAISFLLGDEGVGHEQERKNLPSKSSLMLNNVLGTEPNAASRSLYSLLLFTHSDAG